jgi:DNA-binding transcriptional regulator YiaG
MATKQKKTKLTQELLAQLLGVKSSAVKHWEQGIRKPSPSVRRLLQIIQADPNILEKIFNIAFSNSEKLF